MFMFLVIDSWVDFDKGIRWDGGWFGFVEFEEDGGVVSFSESGFWFLFKSGSEVLGDRGEIGAMDYPVGGAGMLAGMLVCFDNLVFG